MPVVVKPYFEYFQNFREIKKSNDANASFGDGGEEGIRTLVAFDQTVFKTASL